MVTEAPELPSSQGCTEYTAKYGATPSERNPETSWVTSTFGANEKRPTWKWVGNAETHSCISSSHITQTENCQGSPHSQLLLEERKVPRKAPKTPSSDSKWSLCPWDLRTLANKEAVLMGTSASTQHGYCPRVQCRGSRNAGLPVSSPGRGLTAYFTSCFQKVQLLISMYRGASRDPSWSPGELVGISLTFCFWLSWMIKPDCQHRCRRSMYTLLLPQHLWLSPEGWVPGCPGSESQWACIHETHRAVANKETVLNGHMQERSPWSHPPRAQCRGKTTYLPFFHWKGFDCIL